MKITFASSAALIVFAGIQFATAMPAAAPEPQTGAAIFARQSTSPDGTCGLKESGNNNGYRCPSSASCCSQWGWCGSTAEHCGTGCQSGYGTCSGTTNPNPPTSSTTRPPTTTPTTTPPPGGRPRLGSVPYGTVLTSCTVPNTIAITFDDGPYIWTDSLITLLNNAGAKATFFVNGANWGNINDRADVVRRAYNSGHQIGSHTWSHADLSTLGDAGIRSQMNQLESTLLNILGRYPTYMRPPYLSCGGTCTSTLNTLGYHIISANVDTNDWQENYAASRSVIDSSLWSGSLVLCHDVHQESTAAFATYMINTARARGLRMVTVGECLGDSSANWYRTAL